MGERVELRGRPCPRVFSTGRCGGSSEVLNVRQESDRAVRYRRCLACGHRWRTYEIDESPREIDTDDTGAMDATP